jgi:mediator of RNA polymerase II transcription subunit 12
MLRQIGKQISQELTHQAASKKLDELTFKIFNHSMTSEEAYFFAQMTRGVDSSVTGKVDMAQNLTNLLPDIVSQFINNGLRCITDILTGCITAKTEDITECVRRAGEVLRVLSFVTEPLRQEASMLPPLESRIQEEFFTSICGKFKDIESLFNSDGGISSAGYDLAQITHAVIFLSRLLQFYLGFRGSWSPAQKTAASNLSLTIFRLATVRHFCFAETQIAY